MSELTLGQFVLLMGIAFLLGAIPLALGYRQTRKQRQEGNADGE